MESHLRKLVGAATLIFLMSSLQVATPAQAQVLTPAPIWVTLNASAQGNYPGGDVLFIIFIVNSAQNPKENETITDIKLAAPFGSNNAIGLPATLKPGQSIQPTIHLEIPANFSQRSFQANLTLHGTDQNGTATIPLTFTGTAIVDVFALPSSLSPSPQPASQADTISTTLFAAGVGIPSLVAIILLVLLVRAKATSKRTGA
jgi:hypothetical protein